MQVESPHAQSRRIDKLDVPTPLVVPSFSSRGFPLLTDIWKELSHKLYGVCLVSAFDVAEGRIPSDVTDLVNVVFWDSGLFETNYEWTETNGPGAQSNGVKWTKEQYRDTMKSISGTGNSVVVNFDEVGDLENQVLNALEDFSLVPDAASDFLVKPTYESEWVNLPKLGLYLDRLAEVNVIGITAREAGDSLITRCSSIVMLRDMLNRSGLGIPIHIFGAINPYELLAYFFCGADVFDGLSWLRCSFRNCNSIPIGETAMEDFRWNLTDSELNMRAWTNNLRILFRLQDEIQRFGAGGDFASLVAEFPIAQRAAHIANIAGAEIRE